MQEFGVLKASAVGAKKSTRIFMQCDKTLGFTWICSV